MNTFLFDFEILIYLSQLFSHENPIRKARLRPELYTTNGEYPKFRGLI